MATTAPAAGHAEMMAASLGSLDCGLLMTCDFDACGDSFNLDEDFFEASREEAGSGQNTNPGHAAGAANPFGGGDDEDAELSRGSNPNADLLEGERIMFAAVADGAKLMDVNDDYVFHAEIGAGHFGRVFECMRRVDGRLFACKQLDKGQIRDQRNVCREVAVMRKLEHPNILRIVEVYETADDAWIVTELCEGGDLLHHLMRRGGALSETAARTIMKQLFSAVEACHAAGVVHRDLKPENVMLARKPGSDDDVEIKVIDFGLSCIYDGEHELHRVVGTPYYMAPEVLAETHAGYTSACDLWSAGVMFYLLLCGRPPFVSDDQPFVEGVVRKRKRASVEELKRRILSGDFALDFGSWLRCSTEACELVCGCLRVDAKLRLTAREALRHDFIRIDECARSDPEPLGATALEALARFARTTFFHKRLYTTLADTLTTRELRVLRAEFEALDHDDDGFVSVADLVAALRRREHAASRIEVESIFEACDLPADHLVSYDEFVLASVHRCRYLREDRVDALFKKYLDATAGEEYVTAESLRAHGFDDRAVADVFESAQTKLDGKIDRDEFDNLLRLGRVQVRRGMPGTSASTDADAATSHHAAGSASTTGAASGPGIPAKEMSFKRKREFLQGGSRGASSSFGGSMELDREDTKEEHHQHQPPRALTSLPSRTAPARQDSFVKRPEMQERLHKLGVSDKNVRVMTPRIVWTPRSDGPFFTESERQLRDIEHVVEQAEEIDANSVEVLEQRAADSLRELKESEAELDRLLRESQADTEKRAAEGKFLALAETAMHDCKAAAIAFRKHDRLPEAINAFREAKNLTFILEARGVNVADPTAARSSFTALAAQHQAAGGDAGGAFAMPPPSDTEVQRRAERVIPRKRRSLAARFLPNPRRMLALKRKR